MTTKRKKSLLKKGLLPVLAAVLCLAHIYVVSSPKAGQCAVPAEKVYDLSPETVAGSAEIHDTGEKYPELFSPEKPHFVTPDKKTAYLTFDDGPSLNNTEKILQILQDYGVKATFFVTLKKGDDYIPIYRKILSEGHTMGIHTASHDYEKIYRSVDACLKDFSRLSTFLEKNTAARPSVIRFPGGSLNDYNRNISSLLLAEINRRGYTYYDWNVSSGDALPGNVSAEEIINTVKKYAVIYERPTILFHDAPAKESTVSALPQIIEFLLNNGYDIEPITCSTRPVQF